MKVVLHVSQNLSIEVEGDKATDVFEDLSVGQETFGHECCGVCGCQQLRYSVRMNDAEDKFYEVVCTDIKCRARLCMGCKKKPAGALYPKRRWDALSPGEKTNRAAQESECRAGYLPHNGWYVFKKTDAPRKEESHDAPPAKAPF